MNRWVCGAMLAAALGCHAPSEEEVSSVHFTVALPPGHQVPNVELRPVHLWRLRDGEWKVAATGEAARPSGGMDGVSWKLEVPVPSSAEASQLRNDALFTFSTYGGYQSYNWPLAVGTTVLFEDRDGDGTFTLDDPQCSDCDRIYGMTTNATPAIGFIPDIDSHLEELFPEEASTYYYLGGTSHGLVQLQSGGYGAPSLPAPVVLMEQTPTEGALRYVCGYGDGQLTGLSTGAKLTTSLFLDAAVDGGLCGTTVTTCERRDLAAERPPPLELQPGESQRVAQCRLREDVQALIVHMSSFECVECYCVLSHHDEVRLAAPDHLPNWWPCGEDVPICTSTLNFISFAEDCEETAESGAGGAGGAGSGSMP